MKKIIAALMIIAPTYCLAAENDTIHVKNNSVFEIKLPSNPTTGYGWMVQNIPHNVVLTGMEYSQSQDCHGAMGCGGNETLYFKAITKGTGKIVLKYGRTFEKLPEDSTVRTVVVE